MRRILLIAAMLLPISSAMATTSITTSLSAQFDVDGVAHKSVTIGYTSDVDVRAFALDINVGDGMNIGDDAPTGFLRGESISPNKGYGIFPGRFRDFIDPTTPDWDDTNYMPIAPWADAPNSGLGWPSMVVELGTLYSGDPNKPALTGTLFTFDVNSEGNTGGSVTIDAEDLRGGIVGADGTVLADNLPLTVNLGITQGVLVPDCVGLGYTRDQCIAAIVAAGLVVGNDFNVPGTGQALKTVIAQNPAGGTTVDLGTAVDINAVSYPIKYMTVAASLYVNWQNRGRPACWAYPRQCHGDADGKKAGLYWTASSDLAIWKSANTKTEAALNGIPNGICADFDHKKAGLYWVASSDLAIWKQYNQKTEANNPVCGNVPVATRPSPDPNYHYWCLPAGVACPTGQYCAPAGTCPNSL